MGHQNDEVCFNACVIKCGEMTMPLSNGSAKADGNSSWFSSVAMAAVDAVGASRIETLEIVTDVEQISMLLSSLDDSRSGRILSMKDAFGDL